MSLVYRIDKLKNHSHRIGLPHNYICQHLQLILFLPRINGKNISVFAYYYPL
jgi:hypothetical protein